VQATIRHGQSKIEASLFTRSKDIQEDTQLTSGYATWFTAGGAIRIAHYDVIDDVITR